MNRDEGSYQLSHIYDNLQPVRPETERRTAIRQTFPTKVSVEAETSTIVNKKAQLMLAYPRDAKR